MERGEFNPSPEDIGKWSENIGNESDDKRFAPPESEDQPIELARGTEKTETAVREMVMETLDEIVKSQGLREALGVDKSRLETIKGGPDKVAEIVMRVYASRPNEKPTLSGLEAEILKAVDQLQPN